MKLVVCSVTGVNSLSEKQRWYHVQASLGGRFYLFRRDLYVGSEVQS